MKSLVLALVFSAFALPTFAQDAEQAKVLKSIKASTKINVPQEIQGTKFESAYEVVQVSDGIETLKSTHSNVFRTNPCLEYKLIHDAAYAKGETAPRYMDETNEASALSEDVYSDYQETLKTARKAVENAQDLAISNKCLAPNGKCCNISGVLDKCNDDPTRYCEITDTNNCQHGSNNC